MLREEGIATGVHYPIPVHLAPLYLYLGYKKGQFKVSEKFADMELSLPIYPELEESEVDLVCDKLRKYFNA